MYCVTCNRSFLSDKCYQNHLTLTVKSKLVCECRPVCRNCSLLWLHILSLNVSRHSAISVTISSHQSVFATSLRSSLASFHTDLCTFCLIRNARKILNRMMDISNTYRTLCVLSKCVQSVKQLRTWISIVHVWHACARVLAGPHRKIYWVPLAVQNIHGKYLCYFT